jgi:putative transposase
MPRIARQEVSSQFLHILNRGNDRSTVFHKDGDYAAFLRCFAAARARHSVPAFSFCLMPNHFHFVLEIEDPGGLAAFMQQWMTTHVRRYHAHYRTSGHLWQGRFKSFPVTGDAHFLTVVRYVLQNPVRAGLVMRAVDWRWSSLHFPDLIDPPPVELPHDLQEWLDEPLAHTDVDHLRALINQPALLREPRQPGQAP